MLVRFVEPHRRGLEMFVPGDALELPAAEALILMQDGIVVPHDILLVARETRGGS